MLGSVLHQRGDDEGSARAFAEALRLARSRGDERAAAEILIDETIGILDEARDDEALAKLEEARGPIERSRYGAMNRYMTATSKRVVGLELEAEEAIAEIRDGAPSRADRAAPPHGPHLAAFAARARALGFLRLARLGPPSRPAVTT